MFLGLMFSYRKLVMATTLHTWGFIALKRHMLGFLCQASCPQTPIIPSSLVSISRTTPIQCPTSDPISHLLLLPPLPPAHGVPKCLIRHRQLLIKLTAVPILVPCHQCPPKLWHLTPSRLLMKLHLHLTLKAFPIRIPHHLRAHPVTLNHPNSPTHLMTICLLRTTTRHPFSIRKCSQI